MSNETPFYFHPAFIGLFLTTFITGISAIITFTVWLIRQEAKILALNEKILKLEKEVAELWEELIEHREKSEIHFDKSHSRTVQDGNEKQFARIDKNLDEIKQMILKLMDRK